MGTAVVLATLWYLGIGFKFVSCTPWVDDLTRFITETSEFKQVRILTRLDEHENLENPLSEELLVELMEKIPTMLINFEDDFKFPVNSVPDDELGLKTPIDTAATLFLMLIESPNGLPTPMTERFLDTVAKMANYQYSPKYLIVSLVQRQSNNIKDLLEYAWSKKMLDLTIVELAEPKIPRTSILIEQSVALPFIHHLNPFKKEYTGEKWSADLNNFFPEKVSNLEGYPLDITLNDDMGVLGREKSLLLDSMVQRFNFSWSMTDILVSIFGEQISKDYEHFDLGIDLRRSGFDTWDDSLQMVWITSDATYFVVPVSSEPKTSIAADCFIGILLSIAVIFICWIATRRLGMTSYPWQPFNIGRVFFGISISHQPRRTAERILFTSLLTIFAIYSSIIYGAITEITVYDTSEVQYNTLEDLADSSLIFCGIERDVKRASDAFAEFTTVSEDRFIKQAPFACITAGNPNVSSLMKEKSATYYIPLMQSDLGVALKVARPCLATEYFSFQVGRRSPYRWSFDKFIMRSHSAGLINRMINEWVPPSEEQANDEPEVEDTLYKQLIVISIIGYGLSILVFLAEIIYQRIFIYEKSKVQPLLPLISSRKAASRIKVKSHRLVFPHNDKLRVRTAGQLPRASRVPHSKN